MDIVPNSTIILLSGVPLDNTYSDTLYFTTPALQSSHFQTSSAYTRHTYSNQSYQRVGKGVARVDDTADNLYNVNYMMFQNTAYGSKWFYAFVTSVEYVNNTTTDIYFELDVLQTYHFDYELEPCFVERETPETDELYENLQAEPVSVGDIVCHDIIIPSPLTNMGNNRSVVIARAQRNS